MTDRSSPSSFPYRLAAIDIDDTLIGPDKIASEVNLDRVRQLQARGVRVILATGRSFRNMLPYATVMGLADYMVDTFGAQVRHCASGAVLHRKTLDEPDAKRMIEEGRRRGFTILAFRPEGVLADRPSPWIDLCRAVGGGEEPLHWTGYANGESSDIERLVWLGEPAELAAAAEDLRRPINGSMTIIHTIPFALEFLAPGVNKAMGVAAVAGHYGIAPAEVLAFGDGSQDLPMLAWAGLGVAMPHGTAARASARVAPDGDPETALARAIDEILADRG